MTYCERRESPFLLSALRRRSRTENSDFNERKKTYFLSLSKATKAHSHLCFLCKNQPLRPISIEAVKPNPNQHNDSPAPTVFTPKRHSLCSFSSVFSLFFSPLFSLSFFSSPQLGLYYKLIYLCNIFHRVRAQL